MKIVAYLRSSSQESQRRQLNSIPAQQARIEEWARRNGATLVKVFEDKDTGKDFARPGFKDMWTYVRNNKLHITHVICTEVTRFGREGADFLKWFKRYQELSVEVNFIDEWFNFSVPETYSLFYFRIGNAESESRRIGKRTKDIKKDIRQRGYYADTPPVPWVFGPRDQSGRKPLIPNEPIFSAYRVALSLMLNSGMKQRDAADMASVPGHRISTSTFSRMLRNPLLAGYVPIYDDARRLVDVVRGQVEPLISWAQFQQLQELLRVKRARLEAQEMKRLHMAFNPEFPLKQLMRCPHCDGAVRAYFAKGRHGGRFGYYDCGNHYRINLKNATAAVVDALNSFRVRDEDKAIVERAADKAMAVLGLSASKRREALARALSDAQQRITRLKSDYMKLDAEMFSELMAEAKSAERDAQAQLNALDSQGSIAIQMRAKLVGLIDGLGDWWKSASPFQQYEALRMVFPAGFSVQNGALRTPRINGVLVSLCCISVVCVDGVWCFGRGVGEIVEADASALKIEPETIDQDIQLVQNFLQVYAKAS